MEGERKEHNAKDPLIIGRDEMNLAEFPLASLSDRLPENQKTLVFEDRLFDEGRNQWITRRLTISASDKYGLPTALDDEVILGLIQLTKLQNFRDRKVHSSRYELIRLLGWRDEGKSYERIDRSLKRWIGVTLYYDKAWWDKKAQMWVDESFHILDNVTLYDRERYLRQRSGPREESLSSFTWNEIVFRSFESGYVKKLNMETYRQLDSSVAKRLYRFIDKHFYKKHRWEYDLKQLCCEKLGFSRGYHTGELKRKLQPALDELAAVGFLEPLSKDERYRKDAPGKWTVVLTKRSTPEIQMNAGDQKSSLKAALIARGVFPDTATQIVNDPAIPESRIQEKLRIHDETLRRSPKNVIANPAGLLVQSIRKDFPIPISGDATIQRLNKERELRQVERRRAQEELEQREEQARTEPLRAYWDSLSYQQQQILESEAVARCEPFVREQLLRLAEKRDALYHAVREKVIFKHIESLALSA